MAPNVLGACQNWPGSGACQPKPPDDRTEWFPEDPDPRTNGDRHGSSVKAKAPCEGMLLFSGAREPSFPNFHVCSLSFPGVC